MLLRDFQHFGGLFGVEAEREQLLFIIRRRDVRKGHEGRVREFHDAVWAAVFDDDAAAVRIVVDRLDAPDDLRRRCLVQQAFDDMRRDDLVSHGDDDRAIVTR